MVPLFFTVTGILKILKAVESNQGDLIFIIPQKFVDVCCKDSEYLSLTVVDELYVDLSNRMFQKKRNL